MTHAKFNFNQLMLTLIFGIWASQPPPPTPGPGERLKRPGLIRLKLIQSTLTAGEVKEDDAIMADKGFDIEDDLQKVGLKLNIPPFLKDKVGFQEDHAIKTKAIAQQFAKSDEI